jgi:hypothetical protein
VIVVTRWWGVVVVKTADEFSVWTRSGLAVARGKNSADVKKCVPFRNVEGRDFVAYIDEGKLWWFEAVEPEKLQSIELGIKSPCGFHYDWRTGLFIVLAQEGTVRSYRPPGGV